MGNVDKNRKINISRMGLRKERLKKLLILINALLRKTEQEWEMRIQANPLKILCY